MSRLFGFFRSLSLSAKFTLSFASIAMLILFVMMAIVIPLLEKERLENEGVVVDGDKVDLEKYLWR